MSISLKESRGLRLDEDGTVKGSGGGGDDSAAFICSKPLSSVKQCCPCERRVLGLRIRRAFEGVTGGADNEEPHAEQLFGCIH